MSSDKRTIAVTIAKQTGSFPAGTTPLRGYQ